MTTTPMNARPDASYDVVIVGGGPAGLSAALALGRARRPVLLLDAGTPRNARAHEMHNFVTRDGTPPAEFRRIAHEQLAAYPSVVRRDQRVERVTGEPDAFELHLADGTTARARRILLALGMIDELPELPGFRELWGDAIFQCPFCHGWEARDTAWGYLAPAPEMLDFGRFLRSWTDDVVVFTDRRFAVPDDVRARLAEAGVGLEERPIARLVADAAGTGLAAVELADGTRIARHVLAAKPKQRQHALVADLGLALDANGFVQVDARQATSRPGILAAGDLTSPMQAALAAAAAGQLAAAMLCHDVVLGPPAVA